MHPKIRKLLWIFSRTFVTKSKTTMPDPPPPTTHNMNECRRKKHMHLRSNRLIPPAAPPAGRRILVKRGCIGGTAEARLSAAITAVTNGSPLSVCFFCHFWPPVAGVQLFTGERKNAFAFCIFAFPCSVGAPHRDPQAAPALCSLNVLHGACRAASLRIGAHTRALAFPV